MQLHGLTALEIHRFVSDLLYKYFFIYTYYYSKNLPSTTIFNGYKAAFSELSFLIIEIEPFSANTLRKEYVHLRGHGQNHGNYFRKKERKNAEYTRLSMVSP